MHRAIVSIGSGDADAGLGGISRRRRCILLEDCLDLHIAVRHGELIVLDGHAAADDLPLLEAVAFVRLGGQANLRADHSFCMRGGSRSVAAAGHGDGVLGRRSFGYRNGQLLRIAARAVGSLDGKFGGAVRSRRAADLTGIRVQAQTGRQTAVNAPCDRCCAGGGQGLAVCLAHLAVRQGVRGDGHAMAAGSKLRCQLVHICRDAVTRCVQVSVAAKPLKVAAGISVGTGQTIGGRRSKAFTAFYDDLDILGTATQFAAAKVKGNGLQPVWAQGTRAQDFKDRVKTESRQGKLSISAGPLVRRTVPANPTVRRRSARSILSPRIPLTPVFDISIVLVQYPVPFVALGRAAL